MLRGLVLALLAVVVLVVAAMSIGGYRLVVLLRREHTRLWDALGRPTPLFWRLDDFPTWHRFLMTRQYLEVEDERVRRRGRRLRRLHVLAYGLAASALLLAIAGRVVR